MSQISLAPAISPTALSTIYPVMVMLTPEQRWLVIQVEGFQLEPELPLNVPHWIFE